MDKLSFTLESYLDAVCELSVGGWFTPPFMTKRELEAKLKSLYSEAEIWNVGSIAVFRCVK
jgi:hypothetical protein